MTPKNILFILGTRPEAIKSVPVIHALKNCPEFEVKLCVTAQHRDMMDQILHFFDIHPDFDLNLMKKNQSLFEVTSKGLHKLEEVLNSYTPDLIFVQGDTTTAFIGALAGFYKKVKVAHIEAGLRSKNKFSPFPEEMNRVLTSQLTDFHFSPTPKAQQHLIQECITKPVFVVGNTVIDALLWGLQRIHTQGDDMYRSFFASLGIGFEQKIILVTGHRRENFGEPIEQVCQALIQITEQFSDVQIIYSVHLNPNIKDPVHRLLGHQDRIHLIPPLDYAHFIWLMNHSYLILTDSGGIQEEAPSLKKPVLVTREVTERTEGIEAGTAKLVGTQPQVILEEVARLLVDPAYYAQMTQAKNPYGDGKSSEKIAQHIKTLLNITF